MRVRPRTIGPRTIGRSRSAAYACLVACATLAACASVDFDYPKTASTAPAPRADSYWGERLAAVPRVEDGESGFRLVVDGIEALAARLVMAERAEQTIDAQYYLIREDLTSALFLGALVRAADRGVRVRLLLDDVFTAGIGDELWALDAHPSFEVRIFNPFPTRGLRYLRGATSLQRLNRRMHNKSFTSDNQVTLIGGRNIGDKYFGARTDVNFRDLDVACIGPVVREVSTLFDTYWNDRLAVPIAALVGAPDDVDGARTRLREHLAREAERARGTHYAEALDGSVRDLLALEEESFVWCPYELVYDPPAKAASPWHRTATIRTPLVAALDAMREELLVISPYFVPRTSGLEAFRAMRERGVRVRVVTNSLAANNHAVAHSGYAPSRRTLLKLGVELFEVRPDAALAGAERAGRPAPTSLHTKAFVIDRERLFVGSLNWDPRSVLINTEMGIFLDDPGLAASFADFVDGHLPELTYRLSTDRRGRLRWHSRDGGEEHVYRSEPKASCRRRFVAGLLGLLPIQGQL
ncbi:MAG: phospholipase D family protein [bacterium]|nr:phospholipase D family protein [bacterium]